MIAAIQLISLWMMLVYRFNKIEKRGGLHIMEVAVIKNTTSQGIKVMLEN
jgi:hypothetical protein